MRVVIAEDLFLLRDGLTRMLQAHGLVIAAAVGNGEDLLDAIRDDRPDVAIVDVRLPPTFTDEGLRAALIARKQRPGLPILVLSQYVEQLYARELLAGGTGGIGYLLKDRVFDSAQFVDAVRRVANGGTAMDPEVISRLLARNTGDGSLSVLSPREREVLALMAEGRCPPIRLRLSRPSCRTRPLPRRHHRLSTRSTGPGSAACGWLSVLSRWCCCSC